MTKVNINGQEYNIEYNFYISCQYERITGNNGLDVAKEFKSAENIFKLGYVMLLACNDGVDIPDMIVLMKTITPTELTAFINAVGEEINAFYNQGEGEKSDKPADSDDPKND